MQPTIPQPTQQASLEAHFPSNDGKTTHVLKSNPSAMLVAVREGDLGMIRYCGSRLELIGLAASLLAQLQTEGVLQTALDMIPFMPEPESRIKVG